MNRIKKFLYIIPLCLGLCVPILVHNFKSKDVYALEFIPAPLDVSIDLVNNTDYVVDNSFRTYFNLPSDISTSYNYGTDSYDITTNFFTMGSISFNHYYYSTDNSYVLEFKSISCDSSNAFAINGNMYNQNNYEITDDTFTFEGYYGDYIEPYVFHFVLDSNLPDTPPVDDNVGNVWASIQSFWSNWLYDDSVNLDDSLILLGGTLINIDITKGFLVNALSIITIIIILFTAYWVIKWFVNFILGLGGRYE